LLRPLRWALSTLLSSSRFRRAI